MNQQPDNPFASPAMGQTEHPQSSVYHELIPLWVWLGVAVVASVVFTPSDPISMLFILLPSLILLWVGLGLVTAKSRIVQVPLLLLVIAPLILLAMYVGIFNTWTAAWYVAINTSLATFAAWRLGDRRWKVITYFTIGYLLGSLLLATGTIAGAIVATLMAVRQNKSPPETADAPQADSPH